MTIEQIKQMVAGPEYDFLRTNEHLGERILFLTLGGSHAYGTNIENSDVDVRGCASNSPTDILGLTNFEQVTHSDTDTVVYSFNKLIKLLLDCNPNCIEMLGCKPEHYFLITDIGKELVEHRKLFLSKRAVYSFGGYATSQLRRLQNALARDRLPQKQQEEHILNSAQHMMLSFDSKYALLDGGIRLFTDASHRDELDAELYADISLQRYPVRDFSSILNELSNVVKVYEKQLNHRNKKKDDAHLNKHAMHLIRLYLMCIDILETEEIVTYREREHDMLMSIRAGKYQQEDGAFRKEFFEMVTYYEKRLEYAKENTSLPDKPDLKKINELVMSINRRCI